MSLGEFLEWMYEKRATLTFRDSDPNAGPMMVAVDLRRKQDGRHVENVQYITVWDKLETSPGSPDFGELVALTVGMMVDEHNNVDHLKK